MILLLVNDPINCQYYLFVVFFNLVEVSHNQPDNSQDSERIKETVSLRFTHLVFLFN